MVNDRPTGTSGSAERIWDLYQSGGSGSRRGLNLEVILDAAIRIADERGVGELSMSALARELGYSTMALYRHISNKAELLQLMVDTAIGAPPETILEASGWRNQVMMWSMEIAASWRRRQWIFDVPVSGPPVLPNALRWMDMCLSILKPTGLHADMRMMLLSMITSYVRGSEQVLAEVAREVSDRDSESSPESYGAMLARLIPKGTLPAMEEIVNSGALNEYVDVDSEAEHEAELGFGLGLILDGIETLIEQRQPIEEGKDE